MVHVIHARKAEEGGLRFRVWSTISDSYISDEMTEKKLREWTLKDAVCRAIEQHLFEIDDRVQRAIKNGTSSHMDDTRDLIAPWDEEQE